MKSLRLLLCVFPLALTGCATLGSVNWSAAYPWNWFGSSTAVTEQGVGNLTAATPLDENAVSDALDGDYRVRSGMKTASGGITPFSDVFDKAYGNCQKATGDDSAGVECKAKGSQHISYIFSGEWRGPEDLMPSDDTLKNWKVSKTIWRR
ncbi:DUF1131 family protein [Trabulsiella odontotermitis]|uniref:DUF1131 family protein n=1 Tax=Trabulsiella odontotermitis TaxID=379893 RepID=UPI00067652F4|nr:DUF1131 family protein [Trabulsiella odontotermitis]KNC89634.1 RpoE-regulated lipoprotein [Trabulsiella odontotermitis]